MRCKICGVIRAKPNRILTLFDQRICYVCARICDLFSWNGTHLREYWE